MRPFTRNRASSPIGVYGSLALLLAVGLGLAACSGGEGEAKQEEGGLAPTESIVQSSTSSTEDEELQEVQDGTLDEVLHFFLTSPAFKEGEAIPLEYSCDGEDQSPALQWSGVPKGASSFALIMDDPDAPGGTWIHWILYNIPAENSSLPASMPSYMVMVDGSTHGVNSWGRTDYGGPCPPSGKHRYFFRLYALDTTLSIPEGSQIEVITTAMESHILGETSLMGTYER
jgi:Raf kinase inhibitor-like YbhB/YbcL family protein